MRNNKLLFIFFTFLLSNNIFGQWDLNGNTVGAAYIGTNNTASFRIFTEGIHLASFTYGNALNAPVGGGAGDGIRIFDATNPTLGTGILDLFTTNGSKTHIKFGINGSINGTGTASGTRMDYIASGAGFWFNATSGRAIWNRGGVENARMGANSYWRFGLNPGLSADAARRVEIVDADQQLRLTQANGNGYAEFFVRNNSRLLIMPNGGFTGFTSAGDVTYDPTERIDVNGTARLRNVVSATPNALIIGVQNSGVSTDLTLRKLDFSGNANQVLLGNGTWGVLGTVGNANNGLSISTINSTISVFGQDAFQVTDPARLLSNREIPMNTFYTHFSDRDLGDVGVFAIGSTVAPSGKIKLDVVNDTLAVSQSVRSYSFNNYYINTRTGISSVATHANNVIAITGTANNAKIIGYGVRGKASSTDLNAQNLGGSFEGLGANFIENNGVRGYATNSYKLNIGGKFKAEGVQTGFGVPLSIGVYGEGAGPNSYAAYFVGSVLTTGSSLWLSDSTYKDSIMTIGDNIDSLLNSLNPVSYKFNQFAQDRVNAGSDMKLGFLAQEVGNVYPWLVKDVVLPAEYDTLGVQIYPESTFKAVDVTQLIPILVSDAQKKSSTIATLSQQVNSQQQEITAQQQEISNLNDRITTLENCLGGILPFLCQLSQQAIQANTPQAQEQLRKDIAVTLTNRSTIILDQNVPNPFAEQTVINFSIPETVKKAQIHFYNQEGRIIQTVDVVERGLGSVTVFGADLSSGVYTYTLVADGQIVATKKMMKM